MTSPIQADVGLSDAQEVSDLTPGLHTAPDNRGDMALIAHRCRECGTRCFPQRMRCVNCFSDSLEPSQLGRIGKVDAFTIVRQRPPGYYGHVPYVLAMVQVDNDVITLCHLIGDDADGWRRGDTVACCEFVLPVGPERQPKRTYAFRRAEERDFQN